MLYQEPSSQMKTRLCGGRWQKLTLNDWWWLCVGDLSSKLREPRTRLVLSSLLMWVPWIFSNTNVPPHTLLLHASTNPEVTSFSACQFLLTSCERMRTLPPSPHSLGQLQFKGPPHSHTHLDLTQFIIHTSLRNQQMPQMITGTTWGGGRGKPFTRKPPEIPAHKHLVYHVWHAIGPHYRGINTRSSEPMRHCYCFSHGNFTTRGLKTNITAYGDAYVGGVDVSARTWICACVRDHRHPLPVPG